jgi:hypothetical protein
VDGGEANDDEVNVRLTLSQDAVQEFQINRSNYSAELGRASGASINIVSKSGTDHVHGSLYGFFRNDAMDARDPFAFSQALQPGVTFNPAAPDTQSQPIKNSLNRQWFGRAIGFPSRKTKPSQFPRPSQKWVLLQALSCFIESPLFPEWWKLVPVNGKILSSRSHQLGDAGKLLVFFFS